jgi:hypothetical protein
MRLTIKFPHTETTKTEKKKFSAFERVGGYNKKQQHYTCYAVPRITILKIQMDRSTRTKFKAQKLLCLQAINEDDRPTT